MAGNVDITREDLINDFKSLAAKFGNVTRDLYREHGAYSEHTVKKVFGTFTDFAEASQEPVTSTQRTDTISGDRWEIDIRGTSIKTLPELIEEAKVDLSTWAVERFVINKWEVGRKDKSVDLTFTNGVTNGTVYDTGKIHVQPLFQVKATFILKKHLVDARVEIEDLKRLAKESAHWPEVVVKTNRESGNCLEMLIPDLHAGKFAWHKETGHSDYDTPTAIATFERAIATILDRAKGYAFDEIVLGVGNDLLNSDDYNSQTTKGTLVNSDTRYQKTYKAVREMLCRTIEKLRHYCKKVIVKVIPGNHDTQSTFTLGDSLECYFHNYEDVVVDNSPSPHKFYRWGNVFLGFTHGDKGKKQDYGLWMATERPTDFGETKFREIHIGHTHGLKVDEKFGVRVRTFAALCPPDAWHSAEHFVGNLRQAEAIVWNRDEGRIAEFIHTEID